MAEILDQFSDLLENDPPITEEEEGSTEKPNHEEGSTENGTEEESHENEESNEEESEESNEEETPDYSDNALYSFLQSRGIADPAKISVENEDGSTEELDFNALSNDEKLALLQQVTDPGLSQNEIDTITYLRQNGNVTLNQVVDYFSQKAIQDYLTQNPDQAHQRTYTIDDYSNDELYVADLKVKYPSLTDEELTQELEAAKTNDELFTKKCDALRAAYKENEDKEAEALRQADEQKVQALRTNLTTAANNLSEIVLDADDAESDSIEVEDRDKQQMISYILDQDSEGKSQLVKDLEDPDVLMEIAWFRTQGADTLASLSRYWKKELSKSRSEIKSLQSKLAKVDKKNNSTVVTKPSVTTPSNHASVWDTSGLI